VTHGRETGKPGRLKAEPPTVRKVKGKSGEPNSGWLMSGDKRSIPTFSWQKDLNEDGISYERGSSFEFLAGDIKSIEKAAAMGNKVFPRRLIEGGDEMGKKGSKVSDCFKQFRKGEEHQYLEKGEGKRGNFSKKEDVFSGVE